MNKLAKIITAAITGALTLSGATITSATSNNSPPQLEMEKCYGIAKAQMNDCKTDHSSCASTAVKDSQPDAFLLVPKGLCNKIVGGKLKSPTDKS